MSSNLKIKNLSISVGEKEIIKNLNFTFEKGRVYALLGPNGHGKSSLLSTIMGDSHYVITSGSITYDNEKLESLPTFQRAKRGIYLLMQSPHAIRGVKTIDLIKTSKEKISNKLVSILDVYADAIDIAKNISLNEKILEREVNVGFSGGEKKKSELLQMFLINPKVALLDEIDSGLDVDSIKKIANMLQKWRSKDKIIIIVSHYKSLYEIIKPDEVIIMKNGGINQTGDYSLIESIFVKGFDVE